ncbi:MAG: hypothetical protein U1F41_09495 [Burkholderiales bacterium]
MRVVRTSAATADAAFEDKRFGLVVISREDVTGVRSARSVIHGMRGPLDPVVAGHATTTRVLEFDTGTGAVFAGPAHHDFARYADEIAAFVSEGNRQEWVASVAGQRPFPDRTRSGP